MPKHNKPRAGSLQFWPRKKASKFLPSVNWQAISNSGKGLNGFIAYKVGMKSCLVKDLTNDSMMKDKRIIFPVTILETPPMKIFSVRFYKNKKVMKEVLNSNLDKELVKVLKLPKAKLDSRKLIEQVTGYDDIRVIAYSQAKKTIVKKTPDLIELDLGGKLQEKLEFIKDRLDKEINVAEFLKSTHLMDVRGLTKGKGKTGPVQRYGIRLRQHKSEKGVRKVGSIGPWHPAYTTFRVPMAGQMGMFTRLVYNLKLIKIGNDKEINPEYGWKDYGKINTEYIVLRGSVPGPSKRQLLLTFPLRKTKRQDKLKYEFIELR